MYGGTPGGEGHLKGDPLRKNRGLLSVFHDTRKHERGSCFGETKGSGLQKKRGKFPLECF